MKTVLQPLNEKAAKIVTEHADLLEGSTVEPLLLQLVAHVSAYRVILERFQHPPPPHLTSPQAGIPVTHAPANLIVAPEGDC